MTQSSYEKFEFWLMISKKLVWLPFTMVCLCASFIGSYEFASRMFIVTALMWILMRILDEAHIALVAIKERFHNKKL